MSRVTSAIVRKEREEERERRRRGERGRKAKREREARIELINDLTAARNAEFH